MWTNTPEGNQLISEISKDVVAQLAPEELEMFDDLSQEHIQNLQTRMTNRLALEVMCSWP